jgi:hypothetical protein
VLQWREQGGGGRGSRIPDPLWREAIGVARLIGPYQTAKATRFNYQRLKQSSGHQGRGKKPEDVVVGEKRRDPGTNKEVGAGSASKVGKPGAGACGSQGGARFIALQGAPLVPCSPTRIELWGRHGDQMRIEIVGEVDVVGLVQTMWSRLS